MQCRSGNILLNAERAKIADAGETALSSTAMLQHGCQASMYSNGLRHCL